MKRSVLSLALALVAGTSARADDVPFAAPPRANSIPTSETVASLGDIMGKIQSRHIKLWLAIQHKNWPLVDYEVGQTRDSFGNSVLLYRNIPVELILAVDKPLAVIQDAAKSKNAPMVKQGYADLTTACNSCHVAAQVGFITIQTPVTSPFSDQKF